MRHLLTSAFLFFTLFAFGQTQSPDKQTKYELVKDSLTRAGHIDQLIPYLENELKIDPNNEMAYRWLGNIYVNDDKPDLGEKYYREALKINPSCGVCYMHIGRAYVERKDSLKGMEMLNKAISIDPNDPDFYSLRSDLKALTGDNLGAFLDVNKAVKLAPENAAFRGQRGLLNTINGYYDPALSDYSKAIELDPGNYNFYLSRGKLYFKKQQYDLSLADLTKAVETDSTQQILYANRADLYKQMQKYPESIADYNKALTLDPNDFYSYYYRAEDKFTIWDIDGCCEDMNKGYSVLKKTDPENSFKENFEFNLATNCDTSGAGYYIQKGNGYNLLGQYDKTIETCSRGIKKDPGNAYLYVTRSSAYFGIFDYANAVRDCASGIKYQETLYKVIAGHNGNMSEKELKDLVSTTVAILYNTISLSNLNLGHADEALTNIDEAIKIAPAKNSFGSENFYLARGIILTVAGKYQEAKLAFDTCIIYNLSMALAYNERAMLELIMANDIKFIPNLKSLMPNGDPAKINWDLPLKMNIKKDDPGTRAALADCDKAIQLDPNLASAYFLRGDINKEINEGDYCKDLLEADKLGYSVNPKLLKGCKR